MHLISKYSDLYRKFSASMKASNLTQTVFPKALEYRHHSSTQSSPSYRQFKSEALTIMPLMTVDEVPERIRLILEERRRIRGDSMENWDRVASFISFFSA